MDKAQQTRIEMAMAMLHDATVAIKAAKPGDRSEQDRFCQIVLTDVQKAAAVFEKHVLKGEEA